MIKVQEVMLEDNFGVSKRRYILLNSDNQPIVPVMKYLKHLDNIGKTENTLKSYCYHLILYYKFLDEVDNSYGDVSLELLSDFIGWLRHPYGAKKIVPFEEVAAVRSERTINIILTCVIGFYDYLLRFQDYQNEISKIVKTQVSGNRRKFKSFLHHITKGKPVDKNILKLNEPKRRIKTLSEFQIKSIHDACTNTRDSLLLLVLYEGGLRISEALSLWIEDFDIGNNAITN